MISTYRIPSKAPYGFVEIQDDGTLSYEDMILQVDTLERLMDYQKGSREESGPGLPPKEWNREIDSYLCGNAMQPDTYYAMSPAQQNIIQALKLSLKRIKAKGDLAADEE